MIAVVTILSPDNGLTVAAPSGWVHIRQDFSNNISQDLFYKVVTATEPTSYNFNYGQSKDVAGTIASFWQVDTTTPIDDNSGQYNTGGTPSAPEVTTTVSDTLLVFFVGVTDGGSVNPPNTMIELWHASGTTGNQGFSEAFSGPGTTGARSSTTGNENNTIGQLIALRPANDITPGSAGTVMFITRNNGSYTSFEQLRVNHIESWGYSVLPLYENASDPEYDAAISQSDAAYISANVNANSSNSDYMRNSCIGVLNEEATLIDNLWLASSATTTSNPQIEIWNNSPYITQPFTLAERYPLFLVSSNVYYRINGTIAPGAEILGVTPATGGDPNLLTLDVGATAYNTSLPSRGRRVELPWGNSNADFTQVTASGLQLMKRSLEWAAQKNTCSFLYKRAFSSDGTPIINSSSLPTGSEIKFLLYINNKGALISDINVLDVLDTTTFSYVENSLKMDNTVGECAANTCTTFEEGLIFSAVDDNLPLDKSINNDGVLYDDISTIEAGEGTAGNGQVNVNANSVWALLFSVTIN
ncbi:MAG: hypothetical protein C0623_14315 [Desulfuromonas sp.]|nr:MAG: hypothetical protein C0623_14315 [Desulfuromonas sp.]